MTHIQHPAWCDPRLCTSRADHFVEHRSSPMVWKPNGDDTQISVGLSRIDGLDLPDTGEMRVTLGIVTEFGEGASTDLTRIDAQMLAAALGCDAERIGQQHLRSAA